MSNKSLKNEIITSIIVFKTWLATPIALRRLESGTIKLWDQRWSISDNCRQTKQWMPLTNKIKASNHQFIKNCAIIIVCIKLMFIQNILETFSKT